ncbi:MAG: hypothetical protein U0625_08185 [Phycisphaerales bacterium]
MLTAAPAPRTLPDHPTGDAAMRRADRALLHACCRRISLGGRSAIRARGLAASGMQTRERAAGLLATTR